jgi:probable phosphoglycerate mutase
MKRDGENAGSPRDLPRRTRAAPLFLVRHGETDWNLAGRWQGQTDVPLNDAGRAQARALAERMRGEGLVTIASSDLLRARTTAEIVAAELGLAVGVVDHRLREQSFGDFEGLTAQECEERFPEAWARHLADPRTTPPGGESGEEVLARVVPALREIAALGAPALVVMHGRALRTFVREVLGAIPGDPPAVPYDRRIGNGGGWRVGVDAGRFVEAEWLVVPADARARGVEEG